MGCGAWAMYAWLSVAGGLCVAGSWSRGDLLPVVVGLVFLGLGVLVGGASRPGRLTEARRRPVAEQSAAAAGWSLRRATVVSLSAVAIFLAPLVSSMVVDAGVSGSHELLGVCLWAAITSAGIAGLLLARRRGSATWRTVRAQARSRADDPEAEWTWDHPWDPSGASRSFRAYLGTRGMFYGRTCLLVGLLLAPIPGDGSIGSAAISLTRIAFAVAGSIWLVRVWWILAMGHVTLGYLKFPVHPGERASFTLGVSEGGAAILDAEVVLRHFRESRDGTGPGSGLPLATAEIAAAEPLPPAEFTPGVHRRVEFDVPADAPGTAISSANPSWWAVEIRGRTRAGPYEERFLVPVYEKPAAVAAAPATPA
jgi:hypothetical protein